MSYPLSPSPFDSVLPSVMEMDGVKSLCCSRVCVGSERRLNGAEAEASKSLSEAATLDYGDKLHRGTAAAGEEEEGEQR